jgi:ArsR family transcriptional regulator
MNSNATFHIDRHRCHGILIDINMSTLTKTESETLKVSAQFKALADPNRLRILSMLRNPVCCALDLDKGMCACDIESQLKLSQPTISHHMRILRESGLVDAEKVGPWMWYRRNEKALRELAHALERQI